MRSSNFLVRLALVLFALQVFIQGTHSQEQPPPPGPDEPVLAGYDLVAYHSLEPLQDGIPGSEAISYKHTNGYTYYFSTHANRDAFMANATKYLPKYGGFCAWGIAWEYPEEGWPWARDHMGPPCGPRDGWAVLNGSLYCSIWRSYQDDFNQRQDEGIYLADKRWKEFYGSLEAGPQNNGCYAWNWQTCFARSIYTPPGDSGHADEDPPQQAPVGPPPTSSPNGSLFGEDPLTVWSTEQFVLGGDVAWRWNLQNLTTTKPLLIVELAVRENMFLFENSYIGFGVAERLMQGALVTCYQVSTTAEETDTAVTAQKSVEDEVTSVCKTLVGAGMGTAVPQQDPVQPKVLFSQRNESHYVVRFSASLFGCWSNPRLAARVLFSRGIVSGNGDPQPHLNDPLHRQAVTGIDFLSVVDGYNVEDNRPNDSPPPAELEPLPARELWNPVAGKSGAIGILEDRFRVTYELFQHEEEKIVLIELQNVEFQPSSYIGFGFAESTMTGLVMTCAPRFSNEGVLTATCHQWRGQGTNLYPLFKTNDAGGWHLLEVTSEDGFSLNYKLAARAKDVMSMSESQSGGPRAICAIGRSAPDSGTPLMHEARDRQPFYIEGLAASSGQRITAGVGLLATLLLIRSFSV